MKLDVEWKDAYYKYFRSICDMAGISAEDIRNCNKASAEWEALYLKIETCMLKFFNGYSLNGKSLNAQEILLLHKECFPLCVKKIDK